MIADVALDFLARGGKKLRSRLCRAVFARCGGKGDLSPIETAVECFHKASLVHDDIQDGDEVRYGRPTVWKEHGVPAAIAVGDWLVAHGYQLIASSAFPAAPEMMRATVRSHVLLCEGQGDELLGAAGSSVAFDAERYLSICRRKTAEAFALAAELGALAAAADPAPFRRYAIAYGTLFQICDDIADGCDEAELHELRRKYEDETALYCGECAIGVW